MFKNFNRRKKLFLSIVIAAGIILFTLFLSIYLSNDNLKTSVMTKNVAPNLQHPFGTDFMGRDMLTRVTKGLRFSLIVGMIGSIAGCVIALVLGVLSATMSKKVDVTIVWFIDLFIGMPHIVFMILIAYMVGGGAKGIIVAVALTHWTSLARVIRSEIFALKQSDYIQISRNLGQSKFYIARKHIFPHILPHFVIGILLLFPHAIIHEAGVTFLGFGLSVQDPSIGIILSEATKHISTGYWWLAVLPGVFLIIVVKSFDTIAENLRTLYTPSRAHE